jgi:hypothetical protein
VINNNFNASGNVAIYVLDMATIESFLVFVGRDVHPVLAQQFIFRKDISIENA